MLTIHGNNYRHSDGVSRRGFLTIGALGTAGLTLPDLLRAEAAAGIGSSNKAVINIHLDGGPPQMDMIDLKPDAPAEIRGEFSPISTAVAGIQISELLPKLAANANEFAFIRSLVGSAGRHDAFQCQSGFKAKDLASIGGRPAMGAVLSKLYATAGQTAPTYVDLMQGRPLVRNSARPGFLGPAYQPFRPDISHLFTRKLEPGMKGELARLGTDHATSLVLNQQLSARRLTDRTQLLTGLDRIRRDVDSSGMMDAMDRFTQQAVNILTSGRLADALDLEKVDPVTLRRYQFSANAGGERSKYSDGPEATYKLLLARRLIEAGVRCVSVSFSDFDTHRNNFNRLRNVLPMIDHGLDALVADLRERGMFDDVSIVAWGEFGRTPRIDTKTAGRHHWPRVGMGLLAGGGMRTGQAIGVTDRQAATALSRPVHYKDVFATLYRNLGIDATNVTVSDPTGRPQYLLDSGTPLSELA